MCKFSKSSWSLGNYQQILQSLFRTNDCQFLLLIDWNEWQNYVWYKSILKLKGKNKDFWVSYSTLKPSKTIWTNWKLTQITTFSSVELFSLQNSFLGFFSAGRYVGLITKWLNSETEKSPTLSTSINLHDKRNITTHLVKYSRPVKKVP